MHDNKGLRIVILPKSNRVFIPDSLHEVELEPDCENDLLQIALSSTPNSLDEHQLSNGLLYEISTKKLLNPLEGCPYNKELKDVLTNREIKLFEEALRIINDEIATLPTIESLSKRVGFNQNKLQHAFQLAFNTSINEYVKRKRLELAIHYLENTKHNMSKITELIGLTSRSYFAKTFQEYYNIKPSAYRKLRKQNAILKEHLN